MSSRLVAIRNAPLQAVGLTALMSTASLAVATIQHWPLWGMGLAVVMPWIPLFATETARIYRHYGYLALFYVLVVTQTGHFFEHVAQVTQIHVFHLAGASARHLRHAGYRVGALHLEQLGVGRGAAPAPAVSQESLAVGDAGALGLARN